MSGLMDIEPGLVRIAGPDDEYDLMAMAREAHPEMALKGADGNPIALDRDMVRAEIRRCIYPNRSNLPSWIGVIGDVNDLKASICLFCETLWYSSHVVLMERWLYVRPEYRRSNYAATLIDFAKRAADTANIYPLITGHITPGREEAKSRFYRRFLTPIGTCYTHTGHDADATRGAQANGL